MGVLSYKAKVAQIVSIKNESECSVSQIEDGWVINGVQLRKDEFEQILPILFRDVQSEKKRTNCLAILRQLGKDAIIYLPFLTNIIINRWFDEKKFIHSFVETILTITNGLSNYIKQLNDNRYLSDLGTLLEIDKKFELSINCWEKAVKKAPKYFFGWVRLSFCYSQLDNYNKAIAVLWDGVAHYGYNIPSGESKGKLDKKYKFEMESLLDILQKKEKQNYMLFFIRGLMSSYFIKDYKLAVDYFIKSLKLNPLFVEAEIQLARCFGKTGDRKAQIRAYKKILEKDPNNIRTLQELGLYHRERADYDLAVHYFDILHKLEPENEEWIAELAFLYRTSSMKLGARSKKTWTRNLPLSYSYYQKLLALAPDNGDYVSDFNGLLIEMGKHEEAKDLLMNYLIIKGSSKIYLRKLETAYSWLKIPFDEKRVQQEINYQRNKDTAYPRILEFLSTVRPNIPITLPRITKIVEFPEDKMQELLIKLVNENPEVGEYLELEQVFIRKEDTDEIISDLKVKYSTCYYCGMPLDPADLVNCSTCEKEILKCNVCKLPISFGEELGQCSLCESLGHLTHFEEWVKTQGKCPTCLQDIPLQGVIPFEEDIKKK